MNFKENKKHSILTAVFLGLLPVSLAASPVIAAAKTYNSLRLTLIIIAIVLAYMIYKLTSMAKDSYKMKVRRSMKKLSDGTKTNIVLLFVSLQFMFTSVLAQETEAVAEVAEKSALLSLPLDIWFAILVILIELALIIYLLPLEMKLFNENEKEETKLALAEGRVYQSKKVWWKRLINAFGRENTDEELEKLDLDHDYDGIRELDNPIPAWWNVTWGITILFGIIYLIRFFITGGIPDQVQELAMAERKAAIQMEEYLANAGDLIDENNVVMLDQPGIDKGKVLYDKNCIACHGASGEGGIGPNLTDEYWLHKGGIKDIFYSIKYGWPEQGMQSWKDNFSPEQIAQLASYVKSMRGTNPPNAKDPQGEKYTETEE